MTSKRRVTRKRKARVTRISINAFLCKSLQIVSSATNLLRTTSILRSKEIRELRETEQERQSKREREREREIEGRKQPVRRRGEERFARGWANRGNGQVAYLWQPYFGYMNWFPSKVSDVASRRVASFQLKMYREVSGRSPWARFARGHRRCDVTRA